MTALILLAMLLSPAAHAAGFADHARIVNPPRMLAPLVFEDSNHVQHSLSDYRGRYVLLNIWASWCGPCVAEMPSLDALQAQFGTQKLIVLPLSEDRGDQAVAIFYGQHKIARLPAAIDHAGTAPAVLQAQGLPTTLLIDPQGREIVRVEGDQKWDSPEAVAFLNTQIR